MWPFKSNKIIFKHKIELIRKLYPIYSAVKMNLQWRAKIIKHVKANNFSSNSALCDGIRVLMSSSYVVTSPVDIQITTNGDGHTFNWKIPSADISNQLDNKFVSFFDPETYGNHVELPSNTLRTIIKIDTGWLVSAPKEYNLIVTPLCYNEENRFTALLGIQDLTISHEINIPLQWHVLNDTTIIKSGTPLALLNLVPKNRFNYKITAPTVKDEELRARLGMATSISFSKPASQIIREFYKNKV